MEQGESNARTTGEIARSGDRSLFFWGLGLAAGLWYFYLVSPMVARLLLTESIFSYLTKGTPAWRWICLLALSWAVPAGLISAAIERLPRWNLVSSVIIGASFPLISSMFFMESHIPALRDTLTVLVSVAGVWGGRALVARTAVFRRRAPSESTFQTRQDTLGGRISSNIGLLSWFAIPVGLYFSTPLVLAGLVGLLIATVGGRLFRSRLAARIGGIPYLVVGSYFVLWIAYNVLLVDRPAPNESSAVANLRTINTAEVTYLSSSGGIYGSMTDLVAARLLDDTFTGTKAGYNYSITLGATGSVYTAEAKPASDKMGRYGFYSVPDAVVRYSTNASLAPAGQSGRSVQ